MMNKIKGSAGTHSYSQAEKFSYCDFINQELTGDPDLPQLPMDPNSDDLFRVVSKGILLCKLINKTFKNEVDEARLNRDPKNPFQINENHDLCIAAAGKIGCSTINIGGNDLLEGTPHLVMGLLWQIIKRSLVHQIEQLGDLGRLIGADESLAKVPPEQIILRWANYHLKNAGHHRMMTNFSEDIKDAECYAVILSQISPNKISSSDLEAAFREANPLKRAEIVLEWAERLGCRKFVTAQDVIDGNPKLNLAFVATLFKTYPSLGPTAEEIATQKAVELETKLEDVEALLEETLLEKDSINQELTKTKMDFDDLANELGGLQLQLEEVRTEKDQLFSAKKSLEELLDSVTLEKEELNLQLTKVTEEKDDLFAQLEAEINFKLDLETELTSVKSELEQTKKDSRSAIDNLEQLLATERTQKEDFSSRLEATLDELQNVKTAAKQREEDLFSQLEAEVAAKNSLSQELLQTKNKLEDAEKLAREAEQTKDGLFKLLTDTINELEATKVKEDTLRKTLAEETTLRESTQVQLKTLQAEYEQAKADWAEERARLLARIKELEAEVEELRRDMRNKLESAEKDKEEALAAAEAEKARALSEAENEKDLALGKVRLLLTGNQKQGILFKQENSLVAGIVWKKRFFVLKDNLICWYNKEKDVSKEKPKVVVYCEDVRIYELNPADSKKDFAFQLINTNSSNSISVAAETAEDMKEWMTEIRVAKKKRVGQSVVSQEGSSKSKSRS